jgi:hypothetical protein
MSIFSGIARRASDPESPAADGIGSVLLREDAGKSSLALNLSRLLIELLPCSLELDCPPAPCMSIPFEARIGTASGMSFDVVGSPGHTSIDVANWSGC